MLLQDFFDREYYPRRLRGKSENSRRLYRLCIHQFGLTLGHNPTVDDLTEDNVLAHLARRSTVAAATRNKELAELTALWRFASQRGHLTTWPDIQPEHEPERAPIAWLENELESLLDAAVSQCGNIANVPAWMWWNGLIRVMLDVGERVSAIRQAKWSWLQNDWLMVPAEARKGKTRDRRYRISFATVASLDLIRRSGGDKSLIFPWPYSETYLWQRYSQILKAAKLPVGRKYKFHALRKTLGSVVYAAGMDPQDCLDHSDRRTTQRYLDPRFVRTTQPCDVMAALLTHPREKIKKNTG